MLECFGACCFRLTMSNNGSKCWDQGYYDDVEVKTVTARPRSLVRSRRLFFVCFIVVFVLLLLNYFMCKLANYMDGYAVCGIWYITKLLERGSKAR